MEPEGENSSNPQTDHLFCVVYYPSIRNITSKEKAAKYDLQTIQDLGQRKTCDGNDLLDAGVLLYKWEQQPRQLYHWRKVGLKINS